MVPLTTSQNARIKSKYLDLASKPQVKDRTVFNPAGDLLRTTKSPLIANYGKKEVKTVSNVENFLNMRAATLNKVGGGDIGTGTTLILKNPETGKENVLVVRSAINGKRGTDIGGKLEGTDSFKETILKEIQEETFGLIDVSKIKVQPNGVFLSNHKRVDRCYDRLETVSIYEISEDEQNKLLENLNKIAESSGQAVIAVTGKKGNKDVTDQERIDAAKSALSSDDYIRKIDKHINGDGVTYLKAVAESKIGELPRTFSFNRDRTKAADILEECFGVYSQYNGFEVKDKDKFITGVIKAHIVEDKAEALGSSLTNDIPEAERMDIQAREGNVLAAKFPELVPTVINP